MPSSRSLVIDPPAPGIPVDEVTRRSLPDVEIPRQDGLAATLISLGGTQARMLAPFLEHSRFHRTKERLPQVGRIAKWLPNK